MYRKLNIVISILFSFSILSAFEDEQHIRLYVTADVKGETEPCG